MQRQPEYTSNLSRFALGWLVALLATIPLVIQPAQAQESDGSWMSEEDAEASRDVDGGFYDQGNDFFFRLHHHTKHWGEAAGKSEFGITKYFVDEVSSLFVDGEYRLDNKAHNSFSGGVGYRRLHQSWFDGSARIAGVYAWYDGDHGKLGNYFNQFGFGFESLGEKWDFRANAYLPFGDTEQAIGRTMEFGDASTLAFEDHYLTRGTSVLTDFAMNVVDAEAAYHFVQYDYFNLWGFGGVYHLDGDQDDATGVKGGVRGYVASDMSMQLTCAHDDVFKTTVVFGFTWWFNNATAGRTRMSPLSIIDRLRGPIRRNDYVMLTQHRVTGSQMLTDPSGNPLEFVHVNSAAAPGGDGTVESPFATLAGAQTGSTAGDIVFAHSTSVFNGESITLKDDQRFLGEGRLNGTTVTHTVNTQQLGVVTLPESSAGASTGAVPVIQNAPADAVTLADDNEVSGFTITGGARGIVGDTTNQNINVNWVAVSNTTGDGVYIDANGTTTLDQLTFDNIGGNDIALVDKGSMNATITDVTSNNPNGIGIKINQAQGTVQISDYTYNGGANGTGGIRFVSPTGTISVTDATVTGGVGVGLSIADGTGTTTIDNYSYNGGATGAGGLDFSGGGGSNTVSDTTITGGAGYGMRIKDNDGTFTVTDTNITDTGGAGLLVDGGASTTSFGGKITQSNNAAAVAVSGGHTGSVTFTEATSGAGVVDATAGTGLQFNNADGTYTFTNNVNLHGGDAGVDILNGSDGTFTFADATITSPTGTAFNVAGGAATVNFTGKITQANNAAALAVSGGHTGTLTFNEGTSGGGVIDATAGTGLQFDNADGTYTFNHAVTLHGGDAGIDIIDSDGTFTFADATITSPTGTAFYVDGGAANVNFTGLITQANNAAAVYVADASGPHTGTLNFNEATSGAGVVTATAGTGLRFANADGTYNFNHAVTLTGTDGGIDIFSDSDGTFAFANATITNPTGRAFKVSGGSANVNFTGKITYTAHNEAAVYVSNGHDGTITFNEGTTDDGVIDATAGTGLQFNNANGTYNFNHAVTLHGGEAGIDIIDSDGTFTFANTTITNPNGTAFYVDGGAANVNFTGKITQTVHNEAAVYVADASGAHTGTLNFNEATSGAGVVTATAGSGLRFQNADGTYNFNDAVTLTGTTGGIDIFSDSDGTFTFADATITNPTGRALKISGGSANVSFTGKITQTAHNEAAVYVINGHDGSLTLNEGTSGGGVIDATVGTGLQFNNADGTYAFNHAVTLNGGDAGIDILNGSDGTFTFADATITNPTGIAFNVEGGAASASFTGKITQTANNAAAISVSGGHTGTLTFNAASAGTDVVEASTGAGLQFDNADGTYTIGQIALSGGNPSIDISNGSDGTFTFSSGTIDGATGAAVDIDGGAATVAVNADITNTAGNSVEVSNITGGSVTFGGTITDSGTGVLVSNNTGGTVSFNGQLDLDTTTNNAVRLLTNAGAAINFNALDITTTSGNGLTASGGGTITVSGANNTIVTTTGTGLSMSNVTAGAGGVNFESISVDGAANGIWLSSVDGGTISVGAGGSAMGDGGSLANTTGDAVSATNVENLSLNYISIDNSGDDGVFLSHTDTDPYNMTVSLNHLSITGAAGDGVHVTHDATTATSVTVASTDVTNFGGQGVELASTGEGQMTLDLNNSNLSGASGDESILLNVDDDAQQVDITLSQNYVINGNDDKALSLNVAGAGIKTVTTLVSGNTFINDSANVTAEFIDNGAARMNTTVTSNVLVNNGAGPQFEVTSTDAAAWIRLNLTGNSSNGGAGDFDLTNTAGSFSVYDLADVGTNNTGTVNQGGTIWDDPGPIPTP